MESEDVTNEEKCEMLMNVVVESRKRFGKMSVDYDNKCHVMENKMLNLQIETISNYHYKSKNTAPIVDIETLNKDIEDFNSELLKNREKRNNLETQISNTKNIVLQLKRDKLGRKIREPFTAEAMLKRAKQKS